MLNVVGLASLGIFLRFSADADVGCLRHCRRGTLIGADFFVLQVLGWIGFGGCDADAFAPSWQKPLIWGGGSRKSYVITLSVRRNLADKKVRPEAFDNEGC